MAGHDEDAQKQKRRDEFRLAEYHAVLDKIRCAREDMARLEAIYPLAIVAIYAWVFANPPAVKILWSIALTIPVAISLFSVVRIWSRRKHIGLLEAYVRGVEKEIYGDEELGWERTYAAKNPLAWLIWFRFLLALLILALTIWVAADSGTLFDQWQAARTAEL